jgi:hypothetical protein
VFSPRERSLFLVRRWTRLERSILERVFLARSFCFTDLSSKFEQVSTAEIEINAEDVVLSIFLKWAFLQKELENIGPKKLCEAKSYFQFHSSSVHGSKSELIAVCLTLSLFFCRRLKV